MPSKKFLLNAAKLYLVLDDSVADFDKLFDILRRSFNSGISIFQVRSKAGTAKDILTFARKALTVTKNRALFIINDRLDLCLASGCDGVHLGQDDLPLLQARKILGPGKIIGVSCQTPAQALSAQKNGADYIGFGSVFKTKTKPERAPMDRGMISEVCAKIRIPVYFIGGITTENIGQVISGGGRRVAVTRAVCESDDIAGDIRNFLSLLH